MFYFLLKYIFSSKNIIKNDKTESMRKKLFHIKMFEENKILQNWSSATTLVRKIIIIFVNIFNTNFIRKWYWYKNHFWYELFKNDIYLKLSSLLKVVWYITWKLGQQ